MINCSVQYLHFCSAWLAQGVSNSTRSCGGYSSRRPAGHHSSRRATAICITPREEEPDWLIDEPNSATLPVGHSEYIQDGTTIPRNGRGSCHFLIQILHLNVFLTRVLPRLLKKQSLIQDWGSQFLRNSKATTESTSLCRLDFAHVCRYN
jgi:hypothetical protein